MFPYLNLNHILTLINYYFMKIFINKLLLSTQIPRTRMLETVGKGEA